jgi:hypothetical protein
MDIKKISLSLLVVSSFVFAMQSNKVTMADLKEATYLLIKDISQNNAKMAGIANRLANLERTYNTRVNHDLSSKMINSQQNLSKLATNANMTNQRSFRNMENITRLSNEIKELKILLGQASSNSNVLNSRYSPYKNVKNLAPRTNTPKPTIESIVISPSVTPSNQKSTYEYISNINKPQKRYTPRYSNTPTSNTNNFSNTSTSSKYDDEILKFIKENGY